MKNKAVIICGFPGIGKTTAFNLLNKKYRILDSDSSLLDKKSFPTPYISFLREHIYDYEIMFVSAHQLVIRALKDAKMTFTVCYPNIDRKHEFIQNYKDRGDSSNFIKQLNKDFIYLINEIEDCDYYNKIKLNGENEFILNNVEFLGILGLIDEERKYNE